MMISIEHIANKWILVLLVALAGCVPQRDNPKDPDSPFYVPTKVDRAVKAEIENLLPDAEVVLTEGDEYEVLIRLANQPLSNAEVTVAVNNPEVLSVNDTAESILVFTPDNFATKQVVTLTALHDANLTDESAEVSFSSKVFETLTFKVGVIDEDILNISVGGGPTNRILNEGDSSDLTVLLTQQPSEVVTVLVAHNGSGSLSTDKTSLNFSPNNYDTPQTVAITANEEGNVFHEDVTVTFSSTATASDFNYNLTTNENDLAISLTPSAGTINENDTMDVDVLLVSDPGDAITVTLTPSAYKDLLLSDYFLDFDSGTWSIPQTVTLYSEDDINIVNETITLSATSPRTMTSELNFTAVDDDTLTIVVDGDTQLNEGSTMSVFVYLSNEPLSNVTVNLAVDVPGAAQLGATELTFTTANFSAPQEVTLLGLGDANGVDEAAILSASASGLSTVNYNFNVIDDDTIVLLGGVTSVTEGSGGTMTVVLSRDPGAGVTVNLSSDDPGIISVSPASLWFADGTATTPQNVTLTAGSDGDYTNSTATITGSGLNLFDGQAVITNADDSRDLLTFDFLDGPNGALSSDVIGTVGASTVELWVPYDTNITNLVPTITFNGASVSPSSGVGANFTSNPTYNVYAESGNSDAYTIIVLGNDARDNGDGTVTTKISGVTDLWKQCLQGQTADSSCTGSPSNYKFCSTLDNSCQNASYILNGSGTSTAYDTCQALNTSCYAGYCSGWHVADRVELDRLVTAYAKYSGIFFPNNDQGFHWTREALTSNNTQAYYTRMSDGFASWQFKSANNRVRCSR